MSHLKELRKFRKIATKAIAQYPLHDVQINYIGYAENAVYKINAHEGKFLLRLHISEHHNQHAIEQELCILNLLNDKTDFTLQEPVLNRNVQATTIVDGIICSLLTWQEGLIRHQSLTNNHFEKLGKIMAQLHNFADQYRDKIYLQNRNFWTGENMLGDDNLFGSFLGLNQLNGFDEQVFSECKTQVKQAIELHAQNEAHKHGFIHADLHFGNIVWQQDDIVPIDFDDCGFGSYLCDLAVPIYYISAESIARYKDILLNSYCKTRSLSQADLQMMDNFILARHMLMQGWFLKKISYPHIKKYQEEHMANTMSILRAGLE